MADAAWQHGLDLPLLEMLAGRLGQAAAGHGGEDTSGTYLIGAPEHGV